MQCVFFVVVDVVSLSSILAYVLEIHSLFLYHIHCTVHGRMISLLLASKWSFIHMRQICRCRSVPIVRSSAFRPVSVILSDVTFCIERDYLLFWRWIRIHVSHQETYHAVIYSLVIRMPMISDTLFFLSLDLFLCCPFSPIFLVSPCEVDSLVYVNAIIFCLLISGLSNKCYTI